MIGLLEDIEVLLRLGSRRDVVGLLGDIEVILKLCSRGDYSWKGLRSKGSIWDVDRYFKLHGSRSPRVFGSIVSGHSEALGLLW